MRIGITGSSGTGKTTLAKALAEKYGLKFVSGVVRNSPGGQNLMVNNQATTLNQMCIVSTLAAWSEIDNTVHERTPLDGLAHSKAVFNEAQWNVAKQMVDEAFSNYDLVVYCPYYHDWEREYDPWRSNDQDYLMEIQKEIDMYVYGTANATGKLICMANVNTETRLASIALFLESRFDII